MSYNNVTLTELEIHLVDINQPSVIPKDVLNFFMEWKENQGSIPAGISHVPKKGWYIISPALQGKEIIKHFLDSEK